MDIYKTIGVFIMAFILSYGILIPIIVRDYSSRLTAQKVVWALLFALATVLIMP